MTVRVIKHAGNPAMESVEDPSMTVYADAPPRWVTLPPNLGGERRAVQESWVGPCPCGRVHQVQHLSLGDDVHVAECAIVGGFAWYRPQQCTSCDRVLKMGHVVWLELSFKTNEYHRDGEVPEDESQGLFPFGVRCARKAVRR